MCAHTQSIHMMLEKKTLPCKSERAYTVGREGIIKECVMQFRMFSREVNTQGERLWCV